MILNRTVVVLQTLIIVALIGVITVLVTKPDSQKSSENNAYILNFDKADLKRMEAMVSRFSEGNGDNLMIIEPGMDSGPVIHDVSSNGKKIMWNVDHSRDAWYPKDKAKSQFVCRAIRIHERNQDFIDVQLSKCDGYKVDEQLSVLTFTKEKL
ncbi:uncharacterized protein DUF4362 [Paenibacillus taihuensis]|uniref:Uncharacterized protein DUF4362 n=1 Tax=Paenibacillus taihuensis TaxID=1156355 RepID=A0A3D9QWG6_9BACL|nr:DUF4362 domain-containing protein [Paenibacillus taihuensis]REE69623.1 uncharacterized protein DUF4362 [Paenibacillus taihuensis]